MKKISHLFFTLAVSWQMVANEEKPAGNLKATVGAGVLSGVGVSTSLEWLYSPTKSLGYSYNHSYLGSYITPKGDEATNSIYVKQAVGKLLAPISQHECYLSLGIAYRHIKTFNYMFDGIKERDSIPNANGEYTDWGPEIVLSHEWSSGRWFRGLRFIGAFHSAQILKNKVTNDGSDAKWILSADEIETAKRRQKNRFKDSMTNLLVVYWGFTL